MNSPFLRLIIVLLGLGMIRASAAVDTGSMNIHSETWGTTKDGQKVTLYTLHNAKGMEARIPDYGCIIVSLTAPDKDGKFADVVLGFDRLADYEAKNPFFGCVAGRYANRNAKGRFTLAPPKGWKADTTGAQNTAVVFVAPTPTRTDAGSFSANINVLVVPSNADLPSTVVGARNELRGLTGYTSTVDADAALFGGTQAHLLGGTFTDKKSGLKLRNLQLFAVHGGATTVVTGTAAAQGWDTYGSVFDMALRTLTVGG